MPSKIQDLWIILKTGTVLFSRVFKEEVDANLFGAMMSALDTFANALSDGGLSSFNLKDRNFYVFKKKDLLFIASYSSKIKEKRALEELGEIADKFLEKYNISINNFDGNVTDFSEFENEIENFLLKVVNKMQESFW
ncbi:MAG: hypothetical protein ACP6IY_10470 [Promethearchaeia archaeon]